MCKIKTDVPRAVGNTSPLIQSTACRGRERERAEQSECQSRFPRQQQDRHIPAAEAHLEPIRDASHWTTLPSTTHRHTAEQRAEALGGAHKTLDSRGKKNHFIPKYWHFWNESLWYKPCRTCDYRTCSGKILGSLRFASIATWFTCMIIM